MRLASRRRCDVSVSLNSHGYGDVHGVTPCTRDEYRGCGVAVARSSCLPLTNSDGVEGMQGAALQDGLRMLMHLLLLCAHRCAGWAVHMHFSLVCCGLKGRS